MTILGYVANSESSWTMCDHASGVFWPWVKSRIEPILVFIAGEWWNRHYGSVTFMFTVSTCIMCTFGFQTMLLECNYKQYFCKEYSVLRLAGNVPSPAETIMLCFSWGLRIWSFVYLFIIFCRQNKKWKICKEFFFRCPTLTPAALLRLLPPPLPDLC